MAVAARAYWFDRAHLRWPGKPADGHYRLAYSARGQLEANAGSRVRGADLVVVLFAGIFLAAQPNFYRIGLMKLVPSGKRQLVGEAISQLRSAEAVPALDLEDASEIEQSGVSERLAPSLRKMLGWPN